MGYKNPIELADAVEARDVAIREAAKLELLNEFEAKLSRYYEHARGPASDILGELRAKYQSADSRPAQDGERR